MSRDLDFRFFGYVLPNGRNVFLSNRPDVCESQQVKDFIDENVPGIRFQFTDDRGRFESHVQYRWINWVPGWDMPLENLFVFLSEMSWFDRTYPKSYAAWLHCDSSSMRAPTFFGLYLHAAYPGKIKEVVAPLKDYEKELGARQWGHPDVYADISFKMQPETKLLINAWNCGGEEHAHQWLMSSDIKNGKVVRSEKVDVG